MKSEIKSSKKLSLAETIARFLHTPYETFRTRPVNPVARFWFTLAWVAAILAAVGLLIAASVQ